MQNSKVKLINVSLNFVLPKFSARTVFILETEELIR
jgi:hypothetical protein